MAQGQDCWEIAIELSIDSVRGFESSRLQLMTTSELLHGHLSPSCMHIVLWAHVTWILCLRPSAVRNQWRAHWAADLLPLLALPQTLRLKLWNNRRREGHRFHSHFGEGAFEELGVQPRGASLLCELLRLSDIQAPGRCSRGARISTRHS